MRGDLVEKTAADVCRDLAAQGASGILAIDGPGGPGRVVLVDGRIIAAVSPTPRARLGDRLVGAGELDPEDLANALAAQQDGSESLPLGSLLVERGLVRRDAVRVFVQEQVLDALFEIVRWRYGAFAFDPDDGAGGQGVPLSLSVDDALVEVARRQQEWQELSQVIPDLDSVPSFRTGGATATAALEPDEFAVLASVDGTRSVRALAADLGYGEFEAARIVYGLSLLGVVDVRPPQDEIGAALEDALGLGDFEETSADASPPASTEPAPPPPDTDEAAWQDAPPPDTDEATSRQAADASEDTDPVEDTDETPAEPTPVADAARPADGPAEPAAGETDRDSVEEPVSSADDDAPEVWVSSPEDAEPARPLASIDEHEEEAGQILDAEVELPAEVAEPGPDERQQDEDRLPQGPRRSGLGRGLAAIIPAADDLPEPAPADRGTGESDLGRADAAPADAPAPDDAPSWEELAAAAERAASDPDSGRDASVPPQDRATPSAAPTTGPEPGSEAPPSSDAGPPGDASDPDTTTGGERPTPPKPQRGDDNDVSEFLRELSRLSVDPPSDPSRPKPPSRPTPPPPSGGDHDSKKKRRGLFGRG